MAASVLTFADFLFEASIKNEFTLCIFGGMEHFEFKQTDKNLYQRLYLLFMNNACLAEIKVVWIYGYWILLLGKLLNRSIFCALFSLMASPILAVRLRLERGDLLHNT